MATPDPLRDALIGQWERIAGALGSIDLGSPSRIAGWANREVVAHLALQPRLLERFLDTAGPEEHARLSLADNLAGTGALAGAVDAAARAADDADLDFEGSYRRVVPKLLGADLAVSVTTIQGPIALSDYLRTRCIEAVVHGGDLDPPVGPHPEALAVAAAALLDALSVRAGDLVALASAMPPEDWVDRACGRRDAAGPLAAVLPLVS